MKLTYLMIATTLLLGSTAATAKDRADVNYVGGGRYTCSGDSSTCARVKQGNEAVEANREYRREADRARIERSQDQAARRQDEFRRSLKGGKYD